MKCRHCESQLRRTFVDLGSAPPSNAYLTEETLRSPEKWYPLRVLVCEECWLVQTEDFADANELFSADYAYFSSYSTSWLAHCEQYVEELVRRFEMGPGSHVVEVGANDGYLLQYVLGRGITCTGVEPTEGTADAARARGIPIVQEFFGRQVARNMVDAGKRADVIIANNVLAHVPNINDFVSGFTDLLDAHGAAVFEFPHLYRLVAGNQFDTIYHEHFSYLSLTAVSRIFESNGLAIFDAEEQPTHGGSLRVFAQRSDAGRRPRTNTVVKLLEMEKQTGMKTIEYYEGYQRRVDESKNVFLEFLLEASRKGRVVAAYGAAAKGNTLLNYAGIRSDLIAFVVDKNPAKQGKYMPGSRIRIEDEAMLKRARPDYVVILPWNLKDEVGMQLNYVKEWGGALVTAIPRMEVV